MAIEKFKGKFTNEANGCTILVNETIQNIHDLNQLGVYAYLLTKPDSWEPNYKEIMSQFNLSKTTTYKIINKLIDMGLITKQEVRNKGRFSYVHYFVHLHPIPPFPKNKEAATDPVNTESSPFPKKWDPVQPETVKTETYKTKNFTKQKEEEKKDIYIYDFFSDFWKLYPVKKGKVKCQKLWSSLKMNEWPDIQILFDNLLNQIKHDDHWLKGYIPSPYNYLKDERFNDEIQSAPSHYASSVNLDYINETEEQRTQRYIKEKEDRLKTLE